MTEAYAMVRGSRVDSDGPPTYSLALLPEGANFRDEHDWVKLGASSLSVEGVGFAAESFEFSQHGRRIKVEQDVDGGHANLRFVSADE